MILHLNRRIRDLSLDNVRTILSPPDDPLLPAASVDLVFICDTWHHIDQRPHYLALLRKVLRSGGQIAIVDYQKQDTPGGPPMDMRLSREDVQKEFEQGGFRMVKEHSFLPYQYFVVFAPAPKPK
jgi:SAM-dependent methyltransferase